MHIVKWEFETEAEQKSVTDYLDAHGTGFFLFFSWGLTTRVLFFGESIGLDVEDLSVARGYLT